MIVVTATHAIDVLAPKKQDSAPIESSIIGVTPYNYAAVIDYNTRNAPGGVKQGRGSAFFLHVSTGAATAGCVAIPTKLVSLLRWLTPSAHPRILIRVT